jgi:hypothetical protein
MHSLFRAYERLPPCFIKCNQTALTIQFTFKLTSMKQVTVPGLLFVFVLLASCKKEMGNTNNLNNLRDASAAQNDHGHLKQTKTYSSEVPIKWLKMQLDLTRAPGSVPNDLSRMFSYEGVALYESVVNGMPSYQTLVGQLQDLPSMPKTLPGESYNWAECANATLASSSRNFLPLASPANLASIDSLEQAIYNSLKTGDNAKELQRSADLGKEIAKNVFDWSGADGSEIVHPTYVPPVGLGLWVSTPPNFPTSVNPYLGLHRLMVKGSGDGAEQPRPPLYSTDPSSDYYAMQLDVYNVSQNLTAGQIATALFYRDNPGYPGAGHYVATLHQILTQAQPSLDIASLAFVKEGIAIYDGLVNIFKAKYTFNIERPITYIRNILGYSAWLAQFNTPGHPEFPSAHASLGAVSMTALTSVFGENFHFTDHTYDYLGMTPRSFNSLFEVAQDAAISRLYAGIHYRYSIEKGLIWGRKIAENILAKVRFKKGYEFAAE